MMIDPDRFADALYATHPLDAVETRILEMLAAAENEFVPLSVLHDASSLSHGHFYNAWGLLWKKVLRRLRMQPVPVQEEGQTLPYPRRLAAGREQ